MALSSVHSVFPQRSQTEKASAKFKDGVLEIRIPKTEEAKKKEKKVMIQ